MVEHGFYILKESLFDLINYPITEEYIEREYTLGGNHLILPYAENIQEIEKKQKHVIRWVCKGIKLTSTSPDVLEILNKLKKVNRCMLPGLLWLGSTLFLSGMKPLKSQRFHFSLFHRIVSRQ